MANAEMEFDELFSYARMAFFTGDFEKALELGNKARQLDLKLRQQAKETQSSGEESPLPYPTLKENPETAELLAKSLQALDRRDEAIKWFEKAVELEPYRGNRYVELGIAYGSNDQPFKTLEAFAKAEELGCDEEYLGGMYRTLAMVDYDLERYDDAVANFSRAQMHLEPDIDLLMYKALSCSMAGRIGDATDVVSQIIELAPGSYVGYGLSYTFRMHLKQYDRAEEMLNDAAKRIPLLPMDYYFNRSDLELALLAEDENRLHYANAILYLNQGLRLARPDVGEVVNAYLEIADICLKIEDYPSALRLLAAAKNPIRSFNSRLLVFPWDEAPEKEQGLSEEALYVRLSKNPRLMMGESLSALQARAQAAAAAQQAYELKNHDGDGTKTASAYLLPEEPVSYDAETTDKINMLYVAAYTGLNDQMNVRKYAHALTTSKDTAAAYMGRYLEAKAYLELHDPSAEQRYRMLIDFFRRAAIEDPSDIQAMTYRVQCMIDLGMYNEAKKLCGYLSQAVKEPLLKRIHEAEDAENEESGD